MKFSSMRSVYIAGSTVLMSVLSMSANAQSDVLTLISGAGTYGRALYASYTFQDSMILNSIGFLNYNSAATMSYSINGGAFTSVSISDLNDSDNLKWYTLNQSVTAGTVVTVKTENTSSFALASANSGTNVVYNGLYSYDGNATVQHGNNITNSNLRVSNPGSNVAPEPGTFALVLTGGAALLGICIRRRRNAA
jgi:hypothetical protein